MRIQPSATNFAAVVASYFKVAKSVRQQEGRQQFSDPLIYYYSLMDTINNGNDDATELSDPFEGSSSLDHALLESLFYNEMAQMGGHRNEACDGDDLDGFSESSFLLGLGVGSDAVETSAFAAEKELLRGFDVTHSPVPSTLGPASSTAGDSVCWPSDPSVIPVLPPAAPTYVETVSQTQPQAQRLPITVTQQQRYNQLAASRRGIRHNVAPVGPLSASSSNMTKNYSNTTAASLAAVGAAPVILLTDEEKHKKLVTQFTTLAGRLGIALPPYVLENWSANASAQQQGSLPSLSDTSQPSSNTVLPNITAAVPLEEELQSAATEAIAAVTQQNKRPAETSEDASNISTNAKYTKRRKKPRLSDCERKLAELQAENALLKRHLDNISNAKRVTDSERVAAEQRMRQMLQDNAPDEELAPVIQSFTELYSDYGRKRHQELNFHLEQLQRLANPTNFTKMGLWTLAGQSRNKTTGNDPIAGMLQKELEISPQQGRKILEQRQKIQHVCSNLKECLVLLGKLKALCETKTKIFHDRMTKCREILNPKQVVKLLIWIDENSATLGSVCPGWGSEQFRSSTAK